MHSKIRFILLTLLLIAALVIVSETEGLAMGNRPSYNPLPPPQHGNYNGGQGNHGGGRRHHSAPEPSTLLLIGTGLVGLWAFRKKLM